MVVYISRRAFRGSIGHRYMTISQKLIVDERGDLMQDRSLFSNKDKSTMLKESETGDPTKRSSKLTI